MNTIALEEEGCGPTCRSASVLQLADGPLGYVDGMDAYTFVDENPITKADPSGLLGILVHDADSGDASGHAAIVIDNPAAAGLPGTYPSGRAVLSWQGKKEGKVQATYGDLYVYDLNDYLAASYGKIFEWTVACNIATDEALVFAQAKARPTWAADKTNNCAIRVKQTLVASVPNSPLVKLLDNTDVKTPSDMQTVLPISGAVLFGTGKAPGTSHSPST